ncbi:MAG: hypothetical protein ACRDHZ_21250 [Ktedonobacteraceae bacterium]
MLKTKSVCNFQPNAESELYLSLVAAAWQSTVINKALGRYLSEQAVIDIADGNGVVSFWRKLDSHKKAEVLRRFGREGTAEEQADPELWDIVIAGEPKNFFVMAAKYLTLHQLKYGKPWMAAKEITGAHTRALQEKRRRNKA